MPPRKKRPYVYPAHASRRAPNRSRCHSCGIDTWTAHFDALPRILDRPALSAIGELDALMRGLNTWQVTFEHFSKRKAWNIELEPTPKYGSIYRDHKCGVVQPTGVAIIEALPKNTYDDYTF